MKTKNVTGRFVPPQNQQERELLLDGFSPALMEALEWIQDWNHTQSANDLRARYELGCYLRDVYNDMITSSNGGRYGVYAIERLEAVLPESLNSLYATKRYAEHYTPDQIDTLCNLVRGDKSTLRWSHVRLLMRVEDLNERDELQELCFDKCWSSTDLEAEIRRRANLNGVAPSVNSHPGKAGPKIKLPTTAQRHVQMVSNNMATEVKRSTALNTQAPLTDMVRDMPDDDVTEQLLEEVDEAIDILRQAIEQETAVLMDYERSRLVLQNKLDRKQSEGNKGSSTSEAQSGGRRAREPAVN